jgi:membrane-bound inhibitor of C-type lysozyme
MRYLALAVFMVLLTACRSHVAPQWQHWRCDNQRQILWRFTDKPMQHLVLRLDQDATRYRLRQQRSGSGILYANEQLSFHMKGEQGMLYWTKSNAVIGMNCKPE